MAETVIVIGGIVMIVAILNILFRSQIAAIQNRYRPEIVRARTSVKVVGSIVIICVGLLIVLVGVDMLYKAAAL